MSPFFCIRELAMLELQERKENAVRLPMPKEWYDKGVEGAEEDDKDQVKLVIASRTTEADETDDRK